MAAKAARYSQGTRVLPFTFGAMTRALYAVPRGFRTADAPQECGALRTKWNGYNISSHGLTFFKLTSSNVTPH